MQNMNSIRLLLLIPAWLVAAMSSGCAAFYSYHSVPVSVCDAETGAPIADARVELNYRYMATLNAPKPQVSRTDVDGRANVRVASFDARAWTVTANGFIDCEDSLELGKPWDQGLEFRLNRASPREPATTSPSVQHSMDEQRFSVNLIEN